MSHAAKLTLLSASTFAVSTIIFVHFQQQSEKAVILLSLFLPSPLNPFHSQNPRLNPFPMTRILKRGY